VKGRAWTHNEDVILHTFWRVRSHQEMADLLDGRDDRSVRSRCSRLGLVRDTSWSEADLALLHQWYAERVGKALDLEALAAQLGRAKSNVSRKAREFGLTESARERGVKDRRVFKGDTRALRAHRSKSAKERIAANGHPRGMLGKKQSAESIARSVAGAANWRALQSQETMNEFGRRSAETRIKKYGTAAPPGFMDGSSSPYSRTKSGRRADLGDQFFRSSWEANYARFLNMLVNQGEVARWEFEPDTFWFEQIRRGVRSYTPDFKVWRHDGSFYYVEVKGWMDPKSKTKLKRMKKYHPHVELRLFGAKAYRELARKLGSALPGWES
jgi:hypothetical protein